jgi:hypothetical protein
VPWQALQPAKGAAIQWSTYEPLISAANKSQVAILASVTNPPQWAITPDGPETSASVLFISQLAQAFGPALQAIELLPQANTLRGWGAAPNPQSYLGLFKAVQNSLKNRKSPITLAAGGLLPVCGSAEKGVMEDLTWLKNFYKLGAAGSVQVISMQLPESTGAPGDPTSPDRCKTLRHYEDIRTIMIANHHEKGMVWITRFHPSAGTIEQQAAWLGKAYQQIRSQLYIGAAFFDGLNPSVSSEFSIILPSSEYHPAFRILRDLAIQNASGSLKTRPGRAKTTPLNRSR